MMEDKDIGELFRDNPMTHDVKFEESYWDGMEKMLKEERSRKRTGSKSKFKRYSIFGIIGILMTGFSLLYFGAGTLIKHDFRIDHDYVEGSSETPSLKGNVPLNYSGEQSEIQYENQENDLKMNHGQSQNPPKSRSSLIGDSENSSITAEFKSLEDIIIQPVFMEIDSILFSDVDSNFNHLSLVANYRIGDKQYFSLDIMGGYSTIFNSSLNSSINELSNLNSYEFGIGLNYHIKQFYLGIGLNYFEFGETIQYSPTLRHQEEIIDNSYWNEDESIYQKIIKDGYYVKDPSSYDPITGEYTSFIWVGTIDTLNIAVIDSNYITQIDTNRVEYIDNTRSTYNSKNRFSYFEIPLYIGYSHPWKRGNIDVRCGVALGFLKDVQGNYYEEDIEQEIKPINKEDLSSLSLNFQFNPGISYELNTQIEIQVKGVFRYNCNNLFRDIDTYNPNYYSIGGKLGLKYKF